MDEELKIEELEIEEKVPDASPKVDKKPLFETGSIILDDAIVHVLAAKKKSKHDLLARHQSGDTGELKEPFNTQAAVHSLYLIDGHRIHVITEERRVATRIYVEKPPEEPEAA